MRWYKLRSMIFVGSLLLITTACSTSSSSVVSDDSPSYDGNADSLDSLPDCVPELVGSSFWVRTPRGAYDCTASGEWKNRHAAKAPDDENEAPPAWTPRPIEK